MKWCKEKRKGKEPDFMNKPLVTVVVPVFNMESRITECVEKICDSDYPNLEILIVDDGSTDKTGEICDSLERNNARLRVYHAEHAGVSNARNIGIEESKGEFVTFCDGDDYPQKDAYSKMVDAFSPGVEMVCGAIRRKTGRKNKEVNQQAGSYELGHEAYKALLERKMPGGVWGYMFPREQLIDSDRRHKRSFSTKCVVWEDSLFLCEYIYGTKGRAVNIGSTVYNYITTSNSLKRINITDKFVDSTQAYDQILKLCSSEMEVYVKAVEKYGYILSKLVFVGIINRAPREYLSRLEKSFNSIKETYYREAATKKKIAFSKAVFGLFSILR